MGLVSAIITTLLAIVKHLFPLIGMIAKKMRNTVQPCAGVASFILALVAHAQGDKEAHGEGAHHHQ